jgi:FkbM family methyltransferase
MKNIFLDCGTHLCEGLAQFYNMGVINQSFEIHTFEANPSCIIEERVKRFPLKVNTHQKAVWIEDGFIFFNQENHKESQTGSPTDGYSDIDGWGSSIDGIGFTHPGYNTPIKVESIDFSRFIAELPKEANIICKMDIEGSEFIVLRHLIQSGTIQRINEIYIEFHERFMPHESKKSVQKITNDIIKLGVKFNPWY